MTTEYGKIETLYERDEATFKVQVGKLKNRTYSLLKTWHWTEKVDGTNIRCIWKEGELSFGGKTDNAQINADLVKWLYENIIISALANLFPSEVAYSLDNITWQIGKKFEGADEQYEKIIWPHVVIYGEGYGAGIQKGGGEYSPTKKFIVFDVLIDNKWWLSYENVCDIAYKLNLAVVPSFGEMTLEEATEFVKKGFKSKCSINLEKDAEGLVGRPLETLFDKKGHRLIAKLKTKDF